jgi:hypothetical protein
MDCNSFNIVCRKDPDNVNLFEITDEDLYVLENSNCDKNTENVITGNIDDKELTHLAMTLSCSNCICLIARSISTA